MDLTALLFFVGFHLQAIDGSAIALGLPASHQTNNSRQPRKILRKFHSGIAFLAGVKVGAFLSHKGFDVGHGSLAASNTFQLFGKSISSAISLSYGGDGQKLPLLDEIPLANDTVRRGDEEDIVHVTIVRNSSGDTIDKLRRISNVTIADFNRTNHDVIIFESNDATTTAAPAIKSFEAKFLREHNKRVTEINKEIRRRNSKF